MATQRAHRAETPAHPNRLWIWEKHVYLDEFRRSWLPVVIKSNEKFQVILRQEDVTLGEAMSPSQLVPYELPLMWQLYPKDRYRSCDSMYWQILYHIKVLQLLSALPRPGPTGEMLVLMFSLFASHVLFPLHWAPRRKLWPDAAPSHAAVACSAALVGPSALLTTWQGAPEKIPVLLTSSRCSVVSVPLMILAD
uniref:T cell lymphoma breakpoint 1 n=1 Tax=Mus spicilegus TaxID=10103 RepID=A0A8C6GT29_MUSSI